MSVSVVAALQTSSDSPDRIMHAGAMQGRFYLEKWYDTEKHSYLPNAATRSVSCEQIVFVCQEDVDLNDRAFIYLSGLGLVRGAISRTIGPVIYMDIDATPDERARLAASILWLDRRSRFVVNDRRSFPRYVPRNPQSLLGIPGGKTKVSCTIANISPTGASVMSSLRPPLKSKIILGEVHGQIARHHDFGFAIEFSTIQDPVYLDELVGVTDDVLHLHEQAIVSKPESEPEMAMV